MVGNEEIKPGGGGLDGRGQQQGALCPAEPLLEDAQHCERSPTVESDTQNKAPPDAGTS